jgi:hypothetical protein
VEHQPKEDSLQPRGRQHHTARLHALVEDILDQVEDDEPDGFDIGVIAVVVEVVRPKGVGDLDSGHYRPEVGYEPMTEGYFQFQCSDTRRLVQAAMFRNIADYVEIGFDEHYRRQWRTQLDARENAAEDEDEDEWDGDEEDDDGEAAEPDEE